MEKHGGRHEERHGARATPPTAPLARLRQLRLAKDAMDRDWAEPLDLDAVAAHAGYSRFHFVRAFKTVYGETPGQYLSRRRIERAEELLRSADLSVTEICSLVGFSSLGTFSTRFKKQTGLTPSEYRTKHVGRGAALIPGCYALLWAGAFPRRRSEEPGPGDHPTASVPMAREPVAREPEERSSGNRSSEDRNSEEAG